MAIVLACLTAVGWGVSDYFGGDSSRSGSPLAVVAIAEMLGFVLLLPVLAMRGVALPAQPRLLFAVLAGLSVTVELSLIYRAIGEGLAFITAPVGALGALGAVAVGVIGGESLGIEAVIGIGCALLGSGISAWAGSGESAADGSVDWRAVLLCLAAAAAIAVTLSTLHAAGRLDPVWATAVEHASTGVSAGFAVLLLTRRARCPLRHALPEGRSWKLLLVAIAGTGGDLAYVAASKHGALGIVSAISSLYPVTTIALGATLLSARPTRVQVAGISLALTGAALLGIAGQ